MSLKYGAITIDTSIFDRYALNFDRQPLKSLEQFASKPAGLILSEIVIREVRSHLKKKIEESKSTLDKSLRDSTHLDLPETTVSLLRRSLEVLNCDDQAIGVLQEFAANTGADTIIAEHYVKTGELIQLYFDAQPPFSESGQKKSEFPDAICLMSLEAYAKEKGFKILAVSSDKDWTRFAEKSEWIDVETELATALSAFQPQKNAYDFCADLIGNWQEPKFHGFIAELREHLDQRVAQLQTDVNADSHLSWDLSNIEIVLEDFYLIETGDESNDVRPIQIHDGALTFAVRAALSCRAVGDFSLSVYDSFDKDYTYLGGCTEATLFEFETEIFVTVSGDLAGNPSNLDIENVDMEKEQVWVDFGELDPDWHDEDYA